MDAKDNSTSSKIGSFELFGLRFRFWSEMNHYGSRYRDLIRHKTLVGQEYGQINMFYSWAEIF